MARRTMATKKISKTKGPFMFPRINSNFASGKYRPPSRNAGQQDLFRSTDPYATSKPMMPGSGVAPPTGYFQTGVYKGSLGPDGRPTSVRPPTGYFPTATRPPVPGSPQDAINNFSTGQPGQTSSGDIFAAIRNQGATGAPTIGTPPNPNAPPPVPGAPPGPMSSAIGAGGNIDPTTGQPYATPLSPQLAEAATKLSGALAGNPFITAEGKERLRRGLLPDMNMMQPGFWQYTQPDIQQALTGLMQSGGTRPEEQQFMQEQWTPRGLR
jgi:hypothetical protein